MKTTWQFPAPRPRRPRPRVRARARLHGRSPSFDALEGRALLAFTGPVLTVSLVSHTIQAGSGAAATTGTVSRSGTDNALPLTVGLAATSTTGGALPIGLPSAVVIPAGATSAAFNVDAPSGGATAASQTLTIRGSATAEAPLAHDGGYTSAATNFIASAVTTQADGKVVAVGSYYTGSQTAPYQMAAIRYNANGSVDTTFNGGSTALAGASGLSARSMAVAVRPSDGEVFVGGTFQAAGTARFNMVVARFSPAGALDGFQTIVPNQTGYYNEVWSMAVQPDGKVLLGGDVDNGSPTYDDFAVLRLNADGATPDATFGTGGYATTSLSNGGDRAFGLAVQPDGKVVVAGSSFGGNQTSHFAAARFTATGQLDPTFGANGAVTTDVPGDYEEARAVAIQPDGKVVLAGSVSPAGQYPPVDDMALVRYTAAGALDTSFGTNGVVTRDFGGDDRAMAVAVEPDGMIVVGGAANGATSTLARFLPGGAFDASATGTGAGIQSIALQPGGRVVVAGSSPNTANVGTVDAFTGTAAVSGSDTLTVTSGYQAPVAVDDFYTVTKATTLAVAGPGLLANDTAAPGSKLTSYDSTSPAHGTLTINTDGSFTYTPTGNYLGPDIFTYYDYDGTNVSNIATVHLTVTGPDDAPVAGNDSYTVQNYATTAGSLGVASPGVLLNDSDTNGQAITAALAAGPAHGKVALKPDGSFTYVPAVGFFGTDSFTYVANDGTLDSAPATVTLSVVPTGGSIRGVLWNDTDGDGRLDNGEATIAGRTVYLDQNRDGQLDNGEPSTVSAADGSYAFVGLPLGGTYYVAQVLPAGWAQTAPAGTAPQAVTLAAAITVLDFNELAGTADQNVGTYHKNGYTIDTNVNQPGKFTVYGSSDAARYAGSPALSSEWAPSVITLTRDDGVPFTLNSMNLSTIWSSVYSVVVSFTGTRADGTNVSQTFSIGSQLGFHLATFVGFNNLKSVSWSSTTYTNYHQFDDISLSVPTSTTDATGVNLGSRGTTPVAIPENFATLENQPLVVAAPGVLGNDLSPTGKPLRAYLLQVPNHGTIALNQDGSFTYTPAANYSGSDGFEYWVSDGTNSSGVVYDPITVTHVDQAPVAADDAYTVAQGGTLTAAAGVTSIQIAGQSGEFVVGANSYSFTPANSGINAFVLSSPAADNAVEVAVSSASHWFTFEFAAPAGTRLTPGTYAGATRYPFQASTAPGLDVSGDSRGYNKSSGQFTVTQAVYDAAGNLVQFAATFSLTGDGSTALLSGSVMYRATPGQPGGVLVNDNDVERDPLTARLVAGPAHGTIGLNADGSFRYVPDPNFHGVDQFSYVANDGQLDGNVATARITVIPAPGLLDGGFEAVPVGAGSFAYGPAGSPWSFQGPAGLAGNASAFTAGNPDAPDGSQVAFLQRDGAITQALGVADAGTYVLSFLAAQRGNFGTSAEDFRVLVDGVAVGLFQPAGTTYRPYATASFAVGAGSHVVTFQGLNSAGGDNTAFLDGVTLVRAAPGLLDGGFEAVPVGAGSFAYGPAGSPWSFQGPAGLAGNASAFTAGNPDAPDGSQVAFLQRDGAITQALGVADAGTYVLSFLAAQRGNFGTSAEDFRVLVDGVAVGLFQPAGTAYKSYSTATFAVGAGPHVVTFQGLNSAGGDNTAFLDNIQFARA